MLIRISQNSEGIEHYFETGQKQGREQGRDALDRRVHLAGGLDAFSAAVAYTNKHKPWTAHYWHISAGFALENNELDDDTLKAITRDMLAYYYPTHKPEALTVAAEAHRPKIQSEIDKTTGVVHQRLLHIHVAVSKLDIATDTQVRMIPFNIEADRAFQSHLAAKYDLVDPADRKRQEPFTKANIISRWRTDKAPVTQQTKVAELRKGFSGILADVTSIDEAVALLKALDFVAAVDYKKQSSGNRYLQVTTTVGSRHINLRGKGFEALEKQYYSQAELGARKRAGKYQEPAQQDNAAVIARHRQWWLEQQALRPKPRPVAYEAMQNQLEKKFSERLQESRVYYVLYRHNIEERLIQGYRLWEKNNARYLFNNDLHIKIYDRPDRITVQMPDDPLTRRDAVALMLQMAQAKGWDINTLTITGSPEFRTEVLAQIDRLKRDKAPVFLESAASVRSPIPEPAPGKPRLNVVDQAVDDNRQRHAEKLSSEQIAALKTELKAQAVLTYAINHLGLIGSHFSVTADNKIKDDRVKTKPKNVLDFLTKTCNLPFTDALPLLQTLLKQKQRADLRASLAVAYDENGNFVNPAVVSAVNDKIQEVCRVEPMLIGLDEPSEAENQDDDGGGMGLR